MPLCVRLPHSVITFRSSRLVTPLLCPRYSPLATRVFMAALQLEHDFSFLLRLLLSQDAPFFHLVRTCDFSVVFESAPVSHLYYSCPVISIHALCVISLVLAVAPCSTLHCFPSLLVGVFSSPSAVPMRSLILHLCFCLQTLCLC